MKEKKRENTPAVGPQGVLVGVGVALLLEEGQEEADHLRVCMVCMHVPPRVRCEIHEGMIRSWTSNHAYLDGLAQALLVGGVQRKKGA